MTSPSTIGVHDDFSPGESGVSVRSSNHEFSGGVEEVDSFVIDEVRGNDLFDNQLLHRLGDFLLSDPLVVLGGDQDGVNSDGGEFSAVIFVFDSDLGFGVGTEPGDDSL